MSWAHTLSLLWERSGGWMVWNTVLAWIPVALAALLFRRPSIRHEPLWWCGVVVFGLFLPNSPYVVTDLIHLGPTIRWLGPGAPAWTTVVPVYALLVISGFVAYTLALEMAGSYLTRIGRDTWRLPLRFLTHALVAIGIFLGRWPRLNSWEPFTDPSGTLRTIGHSLAWNAAPGLILLLFLVTAVGHALVRGVLGFVAGRRRPPRGVDVVGRSTPWAT